MPTFSIWPPSKWTCECDVIMRRVLPRIRKFRATWRDLTRVDIEFSRTYVSAEVHEDKVIPRTVTRRQGDKNDNNGRQYRLPPSCDLRETGKCLSDMSWSEMIRTLMCVYTEPLFWRGLFVVCVDNIALKCIHVNTMHMSTYFQDTFRIE